MTLQIAKYKKRSNENELRANKCQDQHLTSSLLRQSALYRKIHQDDNMCVMIEFMMKSRWISGPENVAGAQDQEPKVDLITNYKT